MIENNNIEYLNQKDYEDNKVNIEGRVDPVFRKINKNSIGFYIWKVENDKLETVPKIQYGTFYDENSYIIYASSIKGSFSNQDTICRDVKPPTSSNIQRYIHFWLGGNTSAGKSGIAAYKVIELDVHTEYNAVQYREVQGNESVRFLSYFKQGITILSGSAQDKEISDTRLFQISGKKCPIFVQKSTVEWNHFNSGNVMLFQTVNYLFLWIGRTSSSTERLHGIKFALNIRDTHEIPEVSIVDDGYEQSMSIEKKTEWNKHLNLSQRLVHPMSLHVTPKIFNSLKIYKCGHSNVQNSKIYRIEEIKTTQLKQTDLCDSEASYMIDCGDLIGVWIWIGKLTTIQEKAEAMRNARGFVKKKKYSSSTPVIRVVEGFESEEFINLFPIWNDSDATLNKTSSIVGKLDSVTLMQRPKLAAQTQLIDDGTGDLKIYRIDSSNLIELPKVTNGSLFSGDSYIIIYDVMFTLEKNNNSSLNHVIYHWTGKNCPATEKQIGENMVSELCERLGKSTVQTRISEDMEPPHFLQIFKGRLIIFNGKSSEYDSSGLNMREPSSYILKVYGNSTFTSKAIQVSSKTLYTSQDCFVIKTLGRDIWVWCGNCSTGDSREIAKSIGGSLGEYTLVVESKEPEEFWAALSEKMSVNFKRIQSSPSIKNSSLNINLKKPNPALYCICIEQGNIIIQQIIGFEQNDLAPEEIYILDAGTTIYIWTGLLSCQNDKNMCWVMANHYLSSQPMLRDIKKTPITLIKQGSEPPTFIGFFETWDKGLWNTHQSFDYIREEIESSDSINKNQRSNSVHSSSDGNINFDQYPKYPVEILRAESDSLPVGIDPKRKEIHLTHDDFVSIFKMTFSEFEGLPSWRKQELKKRSKLF